MKDVLMTAAKRLTQLGYNIININNSVINIEESTEELCFYKMSGSVTNFIIILNGYRVYGTRERYEELTEALTKKANVGKILCLGIVVGGASAAEFTLNGKFDPVADVMKVRWAADIENGNMIFEKGAPDKIDGIEKIFSSSKENKSPNINSININEPVKISRIIFTIGLIAANIIIFIFLTAEGGSENTDVLLAHGALYAPYVMDGEVYRLVTCMFLHIGIQHLLANMLSLFIFGTRCELYFGNVKFLILYFLSGIGGSVMSITFSGNTVSAGASGAVMGLMAAALIYSKIRHIDFGGLSTYTLLVFAIINIGFGFVYSGIDNLGHIGGFLTGLICGGIIGIYDKRKSDGNGRAI